MADSFVTNPHKIGLVSFDCSALWMQNGRAVREAIESNFEIYRNPAETKKSLVLNYRDMEIPLGHGFWALKLWFVMRTYGLEGMRYIFRRHCALAKEFERHVRSDSRFKIVAPTHLDMVCFRLDSSNEANQKLLHMLNTKANIYLAHSIVDEEFFLRFVICSPLTTKRHVDEAWNIILEEANTMAI